MEIIEHEQHPTSCVINFRQAAPHTFVFLFFVRQKQLQSKDGEHHHLVRTTKFVQEAGRDKLIDIHDKNEKRLARIMSKDYDVINTQKKKREARLGRILDKIIVPLYGYGDILVPFGQVVEEAGRDPLYQNQSIPMIVNIEIVVQEFHHGGELLGETTQELTSLCPICFEPLLTQPERTVRLACTQLIHQSCLEDCLQSGPNCPMCRGIH